MAVGGHVRVRGLGVGERERAVDPGAQLAGRERVADVGAQRRDERGDLVLAADAERRADDPRALGGERAEVELAGRAPEASDVHDPPVRREAADGLGEPRAADVVDDDVRAVPAGRLLHRLGEPSLLARRDDEARAESLEQRARVGPVAPHDRDHRAGPQPGGERDALLAHAGRCTVDDDGIAGAQAAAGRQRVVLGQQAGDRRRALREAPRGRQRHGAARVHGDPLRVRAAGHRHHPLADRQAGHALADLEDLARAVQPADREA